MAMYRWAAIAQGRETGQRLGCNEAGHSCGHALRGGVHLTNGAFLPNTILKVNTELQRTAVFKCLHIISGIHSNRRELLCGICQLEHAFLSGHNPEDS